MSVNPDVNIVKEWILKEIEAENIKPGESLPGLLAIARQLDVTTDNVQVAIHELVTEQIITQKILKRVHVLKFRNRFLPFR